MAGRASVSFQARRACGVAGRRRKVSKMRVGVVVAVAVAGLLAAAPAHADGTINDLQNAGQLDQPFLEYLFSNGFGYLDAQRVLSDGAVACVNDMHDIPVELNISMLTSRAYTEDEAKAVVAAMQQADHTDGRAPLC
jgi:hypothetical protein